MNEGEKWAVQISPWRIFPEGGSKREGVGGMEAEALSVCLRNTREEIESRTTLASL